MAFKVDGFKPVVSDSDDSDDDGVDFDFEKLGPLEVNPAEHKLQYTYCLWYGKKGSAKLRASEYGRSIHFIGRIATVEQWWALYCYLIRPQSLKPYRILHLFKSGIKPMWEDASNAKGGKWIVRLRKNKVDRAWENVCMAMLGEQFLVGHEICGVALSSQYPEDHLSVWNRTASDQASTARIRDTLRRILNLPPATSMEYKPHYDTTKAAAAKVSSSPSAITTATTTTSTTVNNNSVPPAAPAAAAKS